MDILYQWTDTPARSLEELLRAAQRSVKLDNTDALGQWVLGWAYSFNGQRDQAMAAARLAVQLDPSFANGHFLLGLLEALTGDPDRGIARIERGMRLSPQDPITSFYLHCIALGHLAAERYEEAVRWEHRSLQQNSDFWLAHATLASSCGHLGRMDEARGALQEMQRRNPGSPSDAFRMIYSLADPDIIERWVDGLRKAGLKE
jgi:adenylate cyclase